MFVRSAETSDIPSTRRRRLPLFFVNMWLPVALRCRTLPVRVIRNRFAVARCVFCFISSYLSWPRSARPREGPIASLLEAKTMVARVRARSLRRRRRGRLGGRSVARGRLLVVLLRRRDDHDHVASVLLRR